MKRATGLFSKNGVEIIRYADDFVLMGRKIPEEVINYLKRMLDRMKLKVNEEKSCMVNGYKESFDFLGFTFRYSRGLYQNCKYYWNIEPSAKTQKKVRSNIRGYLKKNGHNAPEIIVRDFNAKLRGWINYFTIDKVSYPAKAKRSLRYYLSKKLTRFYKRKSQRKCKLYSKGALDYLIEQYALIDVTRYKSKKLTVKA